MALEYRRKGGENFGDKIDFTNFAMLLYGFCPRTHIFFTFPQTPTLPARNAIFL